MGPHRRYSLHQAMALVERSFSSQHNRSSITRCIRARKTKTLALMPRFRDVLFRPFSRSLAYVLAGVENSIRHPKQHCRCEHDDAGSAAADRDRRRLREHSLQCQARASR